MTRAMIQYHAPQDSDIPSFPHVRSPIRSYHVPIFSIHSGGNVEQKPSSSLVQILHWLQQQIGHRHFLIHSCFLRLGNEVLHYAVVVVAVAVVVVADAVVVVVDYAVMFHVVAEDVVAGLDRCSGHIHPLEVGRMARSV